MTVMKFQELNFPPARSILTKLEELRELVSFSTDKSLDNMTCKYSVVALDDFVTKKTTQFPRAARA